MKNDLALLKKALVIILPLLVLLLLASCGVTEDVAQDPTVLDAQQYQPETVYIGSLLPLSGSEASYGKLLQAAQETAVDIINQAHEVEWELAAEAGLSGYGFSRIELVFRDSAEKEAADPIQPETAATTETAAATGKPGADTTTADKAADDKAADQSAADAAKAEQTAAQAASEAGQSTAEPTAAADDTAADASAPSETPAEPALSAAAEAATELADLGVVALLGAYDTQATVDVAQVAAERKLPLLCGSAAASPLTADTGYDFGGWLQRLAPTVDMQCQLFFAYIKHLNQTANAGITSVGLAYSDDAYGQELLESFNQQAADYGLQVVARIACQKDEDDLALAALRMMRNQPQAVFHYGTAQEVAYFAAAYAAARFAPQAAFCCGETFQDAQFVSKLQSLDVDYWCGLSARPGQLIAEQSEEKVNPSATDMVSGDPELFAYINRLYRERTGVDMDNEALYEFGAVIVLAQAVNAVGSTDPETVYAALQEATFPAPYLAAGQIVLDPAGQNSLIPAYVSRLTAEGLVSVYRQ